MLCRICIVQVNLIQETYALDQAGYTTHTRQHELDHTDHTDRTDQECIYMPCLADI